MLQGLSQYHDPTTLFDVLTSSERSMAALLRTGVLKYRTIGMPTP